jgi:hypothetical protein
MRGLVKMVKYLSIVVIGFLIFIFVINIKKKIAPELPKIITSISKYAAIICIVIAITMIADLIIPTNIIETSVLKNSNSTTVSFGIYRENMNQPAYEILRNGEKVKIKVSTIYSEIKEIILVERNNRVLSFPTVDDYAFIFMLVVFMTPILLFLKKSYQSSAGKFFHFVLNIIPLIMGIASILIIIKLLLVHVFHTISIM